MLTALGTVEDRKEIILLCHPESITALAAEEEAAGHLRGEMQEQEGWEREGNCGDCGIDLRGSLKSTCLLSGSPWPHEAGSMPFF